MNNNEKVLGQDVEEVIAALPQRVSHKIWEWIEKKPTRDAVSDPKNSGPMRIWEMRLKARARIWKHTA